MNTARLKSGFPCSSMVCNSENALLYESANVTSCISMGRVLVTDSMGAMLPVAGTGSNGFFVAQEKAIRDSNKTKILL